MTTRTITLEAVSETTKIKAALFDIFSYGAVSVFQIALMGWLFTVLWAWFIVPIVLVPLLTIPQAVGISMTVRFMTTTTNWSAPKTKLSTSLMRTITQIAVVYSIAFIVKLFL